MAGQQFAQDKTASGVRLAAFSDEFEKISMGTRISGLLGKFTEGLSNINRGGKFVTGGGGEASEGFKAFQRARQAGTAATPPVRSAVVPARKPPPPRDVPINPGGFMDGRFLTGPKPPPPRDVPLNPGGLMDGMFG